MRMIEGVSSSAKDDVPCVVRHLANTWFRERTTQCGSDPWLVGTDDGQGVCDRSSGHPVPAPKSSEPIGDRRSRLLPHPPEYLSGLASNALVVAPECSNEDREGFFGKDAQRRSWFRRSHCPPLGSMALPES